MAAIRPRVQPAGDAAKVTFESGKKLEAAGDLTGAKTAYVRACLLDRAAANFSYSRAQIGDQAVAALERIHQVNVARWLKTQPALAKQLDLVLRDQSIDGALRQIAQASGLEIKLTAGSINDASQIARGDARVDYLDLRNVNVAQALDWVLLPVRMSWRVDGSAVQAGTDRRNPGSSAWVYDVSRISLVSREEIKGLSKADITKTAVKTVEEFMRVVRRELSTADPTDVVWLAPGQLILFGSAKRHAKAARLFADLADPTARMEPFAQTLHKLTAQRAKSTEKLAAGADAAHRRLRIARGHAEFGWQVLAAASGGSFDDEAVTHLMIAWKDPATKQLLRGGGRALVMRSLWMVTEASRALPNSQVLKSLADSARAETATLVTETLKQHSEKQHSEKQHSDHSKGDSKKDNPSKNIDYASVLYAGLALRPSARRLLGFWPRPTRIAPTRRLDCWLRLCSPDPTWTSRD